MGSTGEAADVPQYNEAVEGGARSWKEQNLHSAVHFQF